MWYYSSLNMSERENSNSDLEIELRQYPTIIHSHATTWHDGGVAVLLKNGSIFALASERIGDRYRHSWNSRLAYEYFRRHFEGTDLLDIDSDKNHFKDPAEGLENTGHHLYHAAGAFFGSQYDEAAVLVIDGQGPEDGRRASTTLWKGENRQLRLLEAPYLTDGDFAPNSIGHFYTAIGALAGMKELFEEGKTMGLAPYGRPSIFLDYFHEFAHSNPDGTYFIDPNFIYAVFGNTFGPTHYGWPEQPSEIQRIWDEIISLRGKPLRRVDETVSQEDMDIAYAGQAILEEIVLGLALRAKAITGSDYLCFSGGVALNSVANGKILRSGIFKDIFIFPAAGDDGQAIGKLFYDIHSSGIDVDTSIDNAFYGPFYTKGQLLSAIQKYQDRVQIVESEDFLNEVVSRLIEGRVIGWFQGGSELGPRALGHRSILADPRRGDIRDYVNSQVKHREWYRPLAPVVLEEELGNYFDLDRPSPFMLLVAGVKSEKRGSIPAVTHIDGTARVQTINVNQDERFYELVKRFGEKTGVPVLLNTSFNRRGEPIVETPENALEAFVNMNIDALILDDIVLVKKTQI